VNDNKGGFQVLKRRVWRRRRKYTSKTSVYFYDTTQRHIPEGCHLRQWSTFSAPPPPITLTLKLRLKQKVAKAVPLASPCLSICPQVTTPRTDHHILIKCSRPYWGVLPKIGNTFQFWLKSDTYLHFYTCASQALTCYTFHVRKMFWTTSAEKNETLFCAHTIYLSPNFLRFLNMSHHNSRAVESDRSTRVFHGIYKAVSTVRIRKF
jgi:hypothetical protein